MNSFPRNSGTPVITKDPASTSYIKYSAALDRKQPEETAEGTPDSEGNSRLQRQQVGDHHGSGHTYRQRVANTSQETSSFSTSLQKS